LLGFLAFLVALLLVWSPAIAQNAQSTQSDCSPAPNTSTTPQQVVKTVIDALRDNDENNTGIATVYCFASPTNKSSTGPIDRFTTMITNGYSHMLNHAYNYTEEMKIENDIAQQPVWLVTRDGREYGCLFTVGKQTEGEFAGMWMTEAVMPLKRKGTLGLGI